MLFLALPVSTANTVYHVSFVALLVGAVVVLISSLALVWSGSVRENDLSQRLTNLETTSAQANAEVAKAREQLTAANKQVADATSAAAKAEQEAAEARASGAKALGLATGREITAENFGLFINFVRTVMKGRVILQAVMSDAESMHFARQLSDLLKSAGYDVEENYGSATLLGDPPVGVQMKIRSMEEQPPYAGSLQRGLEFIGIDTTGSLDSTAADAVIIYVGTKP